MKRVSAMKRFVLVLVGVLFLALAGCMGTTESPSVHATNANNTLTAVYTTPSPTGTPVPNNKVLIQVLNTTLGTDVVLDDLSKALDAHYEVMDIRFIPPDGELFIVQIYVRCICIKNDNCCTTERTFIIIANTMRAANEQIIGRIPDTVLEVNVFCLANNDVSIGMARVNWEDLKSYITNGSVGGYQLGIRTGFTPSP
jgi:hypothetical protein